MHWQSLVALRTVSTYYYYAAVYAHPTQHTLKLYSPMAQQVDTQSWKVYAGFFGIGDSW